MAELESLQQLLVAESHRIEMDEIDSQVRDFEQFLEDMDIIISKKNLLLNREDTVPQEVLFNYRGY